KPPRLVPGDRLGRRLLQPDRLKPHSISPRELRTPPDPALGDPDGGRDLGGRGPLPPSLQVGRPWRADQRHAPQQRAALRRGQDPRLGLDFAPRTHQNLSRGRTSTGLEYRNRGSIVDPATVPCERPGVEPTVVREYDEPLFEPTRDAAMSEEAE